MATTTFSGPVVSRGGMYNAGSGSNVAITAPTTLTVASHAGRLLVVNDADCVITLPTIVAGSVEETNNQGAVFRILIQTAATDFDIVTDGTDKYVGSVYIGVNDASGKTFIPTSTNDVITLNGTTKGGLVNSYLEITAVESAKYFVNAWLLGSGTLVTPFADS